MKKIILILLSLIIIFSFNIYIHAEDGELECGVNAKKIKIKETGITPAGFTVKVPKCEMKKKTTGPLSERYMDVGANDLPSFIAAIEAGQERVTYIAQMDAENKNMSYSSMPRCDDPEARVFFSATCTAEAPEIDPVDKAEAQDSKAFIPLYEDKTWLGPPEDKPTGSGWSCEGVAKGTVYCICENCKHVGDVCPDGSTNSNGLCCPNGTFNSAGICCPSGSRKSGDICCPNGSHNSDGICCPSGYNNSDGKCCAVGSTNIGGTCTYSGSASQDYPIDDKASYNQRYVVLTAKTKVEQYSASNIFCDKGYSLRCPVYECHEKDMKVEACSPDYILDKSGADVYCVNPGQGFPKEASTNIAEYIVDEDFDVNSCANSYSTVDCGYANILIESEYNKKIGTSVSNDATNIALRLWGAHSSQRGFDGIGIANVVGSSCGEWGFFVNNGNGVNVYKYTEKYIREELKEIFYDVAYSYEYIPPTGKKLGETFASIACTDDYDSSLLGVMCGTNNAYRQGIDLYFNTLIGNKEMKNHLALLFGGAVDTKPDDIRVVEKSKGDDESEVAFELDYYEFSTLDTEEVVFDCDKLDDVSPEDKLKIEPYCETKVYLLDENGKRVSDEIGIDSCRKGSGCTTETFRYAVCERTGQDYTPIYYKMVYQENSVSKYLRKYQSCSNANENQVMFAFDTDELSKDLKDTDNSGKPTKIVKRGETVGTYQISCNISGSCNETGINKSGTSGTFASCENNNGSNNIQRDNTFSNSIKDPSLKCIVNMPSTTRNYYDFSNYFGVNSNLCRVYCSDEVDYTFSNRINAVAGETFNFDIEKFSYKETKSDHQLSSIVSEKRTCVSQVYYKLNFPEEINWKSLYGITNEDMKEAKLDRIDNASQLLSVLLVKSQNEANRKENLNQVVFDLYNCFLLDKSNFSNLDVPRNNVIENVYENIKYLFGETNNYGFDDSERICSKGSNGKVTCTSSGSQNKCSVLGEGNREKCIDMQGVQYAFGAEYSNDSRLNEVSLSTDNSSIRTNISNVRYCDGADCMKYVPGSSANYDYSGFVNIDNISFTDHISKYRIPNYSYAMFDVSVDIGLYNNMKFQTKPGTGYIVNITDGDAYPGYITLDDYLYPVSKNAVNLNINDCIRINEDSKYVTKRCDINYVLGATVSTPMIHTFYRKSNKDEFFSAINSSDNKFKCSIDIKIPRVTTCKDDRCELGDATIYRNVSPTVMFPNGLYYDNSNWATVEGQIAKNEIETTSDDLRFTKNLLDYSISLSTSQIMALREYNEHNRDYMNEDIYDCIEVDGTYRNCKSSFLRILRGDTNQNMTMYGTLDEKYNGSKYFGNN